MQPGPENDPATRVPAGMVRRPRSAARRVENRVRIGAGVVLVILLGFIVQATRPESRPDRWIRVEYGVQGLH